MCTLGTAGDELADVESVERFPGLVLMSIRNHYAGRLHGRVTDQRLHGPAQHGLPAD